MSQGWVGQDPVDSELQDNRGNKNVHPKKLAVVEIGGWKAPQKIISTSTISKMEKQAGCQKHWVLVPRLPLWTEAGFLPFLGFS